MKIVIKMPVLKAKVVVYIDDHQELTKYSGAFDSNAPYLARCIYRFEAKAKLCFNVAIHSKSHSLSVIAHEAVHAASFIQDGMGCVADFNNDELSAYIVQHICEQVEKRLE